jgi:adenine-specific DNA methylase
MIYPKRLIEVDLPIKRISAHARREKSIRHGHISTLHIWWARRPLAACRAVICASLWIDPVDELCPQRFRDQAVEIITKFAQKAAADGCCSPENWSKWKILVKPENKLDSQNPKHLNSLRYLLLDFIADFANWDNSTQSDYLETARALTQAAHEALGGEVGTRPLVVDPFAGGGSIPLEALRVGADAFASDLNPVAVLLNKVVLEYIPKYGQTLADEVRKWGQWVKEEAEKELGEFYPKDEDGSTPIAYLWARTIISEAPDDGTGIPVEVPLMRSLWLAKKASRYRALRWVRDASGIVQTETIEVTYADGITRKVRRPLLEIFEPKSEKEIEKGTVARGSATCPVTGFTTLVASVKRQLKKRQGGANDARLFCVVVTNSNTQGKVYRSPNNNDLEAVKKASEELKKREREYQGELSMIPDEPTEQYDTFVNRGPLYGMTNWSHYFNSRQSLALTTLVSVLKKAETLISTEKNLEFAVAIQTLLAFVVDKMADGNSAQIWWMSSGSKTVGTFTRQAISMIWDFGELPLTNAPSRNIHEATEWIVKVIEHILRFSEGKIGYGQSLLSDACTNFLPNQSVNALITDPPYYYSVQYSDLSDFFYIWLRRTIGNKYPTFFDSPLTNKSNEIIVQSPSHEFAKSGKNNAFYESKMQLAMSESCRILSDDGIGIVVFAHKSTSGWESQLQAMINAGWKITASWAIDTERGIRLQSMNKAALASSIHLVCRSRIKNEIGDWRDILQELPKRIKEWMPRLTEQGVVGADAIFACLGPALEIFSRYSTVEKASGEIVPLREYLEYVWAAISKEALSTIFKDADTSNFEEDARLTAMWLWTLSAGEPSPPAPLPDGEGSEDDDDDENTSKKPKITGFSLEYDTARKIAQGLGAHLENLTHLVEVKGDKARLLPVKERAAYLFGKEGIIPDIPKKKAKGDKQLTLIGVLDELPEDEHGEIKISRIGETICDKVHQAMLLFNSGRSEALKRFLVDEAIGKDIKFWQLAQSFSALYPTGTDEKRWVDGLLARKKGLGL